MSIIFNINAVFPKRDLSKRLNLLDELRGVAIVLMVIYHLFYSAAFLFSMDWGVKGYIAMTPIEPFIAITFIFISGICCSLSHSNLIRGVKLLFVALCVTLVTVLFTPGNEIYFGVLHLLSIAMIIYSLLELPLGRLPAVPSAVVCFILYFLLWGVPHGYLGVDFLKILYLPIQLYSSDFAAVLGFPSQSFFSADYFPYFSFPRRLFPRQSRKGKRLSRIFEAAQGKTSCLFGQTFALYLRCASAGYCFGFIFNFPFHGNFCSVEA